MFSSKSKGRRVCVKMICYLDIGQFAFIQFQCNIYIVVPNSQPVLMMLKVQSSKVIKP